MIFVTDAQDQTLTITLDQVTFPLMLEALKDAPAVERLILNYLRGIQEQTDALAKETIREFAEIASNEDRTAVFDAITSVRIQQEAQRVEAKRLEAERREAERLEAERIVEELKG